MSPIVSEDLQNQIVSAVRKGNEVATAKIKTAVDAVKTSAPKLPAAPKLPEGKLDVAKARQSALAYAGKLPAPVDVVESAFGLADRVVDSQRKLIGSQRKLAGDALNKATAALRPAAKQAEETKQAEAAKPAAKPAAKATAKPAAKAASAK